MKTKVSHVVMAFVLCAAALLGYGAFYHAVMAKSLAAAALESEIQAKTEVSVRSTSVQTMLAQIADGEQLIQKYFVPETGVVTFVDEIQSRGTKPGAVVSTGSVETVDKEGQPALVLTLTIRGTFDAVMRAIGAIEYAPYNLSITALSMKHEGSESWMAELTVRAGSMPSRGTTSVPAPATRPTVSLNTSYVP